MEVGQGQGADIWRGSVVKDADMWRRSGTRDADMLTGQEHADIWIMVEFMAG